MKCKECGGTKRPDGGCNLCELFQGGQAYAGVEQCRHNKPSQSQALKVRPKDVPFHMDEAKKRGVPTSFTKDGRPEFQGRPHQKAYLKAFHFVNHDGSYGD